MSEKINLSVEEWVRLVSADEGDKAGIPVWFRTSGNSMLPLIRPNKDNVMLLPSEPEELKPGDIVLFPWNGIYADYCLHRIYKIDGDRVQTFGDGNRHPDGWIKRSDVLGKAVLIQRSRKQIQCDDPKRVRRSNIWNSLLPVRGLLLFPMRCYLKIQKIIFRKNR